MWWKGATAMKRVFFVIGRKMHFFKTLSGPCPTQLSRTPVPVGSVDFWCFMYIFISLPYWGPTPTYPRSVYAVYYCRVSKRWSSLVVYTPKITPTVQCLDRGQLPHSWSDGCVSPDDAGYLSIERLLRRFVSFLSTCGKKGFFLTLPPDQVSQERSTTRTPRLLVVIYNCCNTKDVRTI